jgi:hypothetical protein
VQSIQTEYFFDKKYDKCLKILTHIKGNNPMDPSNDSDITEYRVEGIGLVKAIAKFPSTGASFEKTLTSFK